LAVKVGFVDSSTREEVTMGNVFVMRQKFMDRAEALAEERSAESKV
jgi:hypothetical protein